MCVRSVLVPAGLGGTGELLEFVSEHVQKCIVNRPAAVAGKL